ncbi:hypothetical protein [Rhizobium terrae]|uniref:hypothetical protein n=1 Tax=Rhizobium terrae TaxID=2171756 RepID=UPI0013C3682A|nr:hypothetical protein [Rhizobium terrae]
MTSISVTEPGALLILQQTNAQAAKNEEEEKAKKPDLVQVANGITGKPAEETMKAAFAVNVALMEMDGKNQMVADAKTFIDSENFLVSDPAIKEMLKGLLSEKSTEFIQMVRAQREAHGAISQEDLFAVVLPMMIAGNRERFTADEIEIGIKLTNDNGIVIFLPDDEGNSSHRELAKALEEAENLYLKTGDDRALNQLRAEEAKITGTWKRVLGVPAENSLTMVDIDDVRYAPWIK